MLQQQMMQPGQSGGGRGRYSQALTQLGSQNDKMAQ